ncbi:MAG: glycosyltransferase family 2 protein [Planctomycetes bacterium]|nr:glycosyltransferase family 2 protein [Planctomycetota bacterium]
MKISAVVICGNEERNIGDCLDTVKWCDEIVVVDSLSADRTVEIARRYTDRVIQRPWPGYVAQKQFALEQAGGDWILSLDADERCTPELRDAIRRTLPEADGIAGFEVKRHVYYLGRWIDHGGWYPDWKLRVVRRGRARWTGVDPHDMLVADGPVRRLDADLVHYTYRDFAHQIRIVNHFSDVITDEWVKQGRRFSLLDALFHPPAKFFECYVWKLGFLDGWPGFVIAVASAFYTFARQVKMWERDYAD